METGDPHWKKELLNSSHIQNTDEYLSVVLHAFMLELGFLNKNGEGRNIIPEFRTSAGQTFKYYFRDNSVFQLVVFRHSQLVKIFGLHGGTSYSTTISKPEDFIRQDGSKLTLLHAGTLSKKFKNEVGFPLLQSARLAAGLQCGGLISLPPEILLQIFYKLDLKSAINLGRTCSELNILSKDSSIWKLFLKRDFSNQGGGENPRELYITLHRSRTSRSRHPPILPLNPLNPFPDPEYPDFPPDPFNPPGIIGGDYDLYPFLNPRGGLRGGFRPRFDPPGPNFPRRGPPRFGPPGGGGFGGGFGGFF